MEREISGGAMLGIVLLALAAVIGLGFGVFAIAKGVANEGTVNVQDSLGTVSTQVFLDFDQKIITGTQAVSAIKTFEGKPYAVLISTKALMGNQPIASATDRPAASPAYIVADGTGTSSLKYVNYNAVLSSNASGAKPATVAGGGTVQTVTPASGSTLTLQNGTFIAPFGFALTTANAATGEAGGGIVFDQAIGGIYKSGNAEFLPSGTKFRANLIKDKSGAIMGIVLSQI